MTSRRQFLGSLGTVGVASVIGTPAVGWTQGGTDWPEFQADPQHTGYTTAFEGPVADVEPVWERDLGSPVHAQPVHAGGTVVVSAIGPNDETGRLAAFGTDGTEQWSQTASLSVLSAPTVAGETVFQTGPETLTARSRTDGTVTWSVETPTSAFASPLVVEDTVFVGTRRGTVRALAADSGEERFTTAIDGIVSGTPAYRDGTLVVGTDTGTVAAIETETGDIRWTEQVGAAIRCPVTIGDQQAFVATATGRLVAVDLAGGREQWTFERTPETVASPVYADGTLYWNGGGQVFAVAAEDGAQRWRQETDGYTALNRVSPSPVATRGTLYVTTGRSSLYALDRSDGSERWTFSPPSSAEIRSASVGDGRVYAGTSDGILYALEGSTNSPPEPAIAYAPREPDPGETVTLDATQSTDPDGSISTYRWDLDGDGEPDATAETVDHTFTEGTHTVSLEVVDDEGRQASTTAEISVGLSGQAAGAGSGDDPLAAYVDRVPGDELGVAGGAAGLLGLVGLYRLLARRRSGTADTGPKTDADQAEGHGSARSSEAASQADSGAGTGSPDPADATFDAFEIDETLGGGTLTQVTDGRYRPDGTPVAVETLAGSPGHTVHEALFERFTDGVDVWSEIDDHPNVVTVRASGAAPYPWAALERCSSPLDPATVGDRSFAEIQSFLVDVLEGVHEGHRHGLYHGALTPNNVMLVERDEEQVAAVGDWEVSAAQLDPALNVAEMYPRFATPEQVDPDRFRDPDSLTDVYQVGVLTYALTTGSYPFDGPPDGDRDADELISPSEFASDVPEELEGVLTTALATDPRRRYQTALHFRDALDRF